MEPTPCRLEPEIVPPEGSSGAAAHPTILLWERTDNGEVMRIPVDPLVSRCEIQEAVCSLDCEDYEGVPVAHIRWHRISCRVALQLLYETFVVHGIPVFPSQEDAMKGWDGLFSRPTTNPHPASSPAAGGGVVARTEGNHPLSAGGLEGDGLFATGVHVIQNLTQLVNASEDDPMFSHLWVVGSVCRFPLTLLQTCHATLGMDLCERVATMSPKAIVRAYSLGNVTVPLLVWYRSYKNRVVSMIQEYLHIVYSHVPEVRVWHYSLIPHSSPSRLVALEFRRTDILPSWHGLWQYTADTEGCAPVEFDQLEASGHRLVRDPDRRYMFTEYEDYHPTTSAAAAAATPSVMWFAPEVFFYVTLPVGKNGGCTAVANVRPPASHTELPPWVLPLLEEQQPVGRPVDRRALVRNVDRYLAAFAIDDEDDHADHDKGRSGRSRRRAVRLFRRINWATLPLHWQPQFLRNLPLRINRQESEEAQSRLVHNVRSAKVTGWVDLDDADVLEATRLLGRITGVRLDR